MPCSAVTLSLATITGIIATALLAIAFSTDNWLYTEVKRAQIQVRRTQFLISRNSTPFTLDYPRRLVYFPECHGAWRSLRSSDEEKEPDREGFF
ncbi:hypothetical protein M0802_003693 [Mischocyttarus mexicanus]|nr:hypothetical protein M0802_003693 [Mischocyttarus mexicanus]